MVLKNTTRHYRTISTYPHIYLCHHEDSICPRDPGRGGHVIPSDCHEATTVSTQGYGNGSVTPRPAGPSASKP